MAKLSTETEKDQPDFSKAPPWLIRSEMAPAAHRQQCGGWFGRGSGQRVNLTLLGGEVARMGVLWVTGGA
jgi:hypothetical protein